MLRWFIKSASPLLRILTAEKLHFRTPFVEQLFAVLLLVEHLSYTVQITNIFVNYFVNTLKQRFLLAGMFPLVVMHRGPFCPPLPPPPPYVSSPEKTYSE